MAVPRYSTTSSRPLGVEEIVKQALDYEFISERPLKAWLRSAKLLLTEARICEQDGDIQRAYLFLYRHANLVIVKFPQHPEYKDPQLKAGIVANGRIVEENLKKLEQWKPKIKRDHERYVQAIERRNAERQRVEAERLSDQQERVANDEFGRLSVGADGGAYDDERGQALDANEHRQLAVDLAHQEIRRRDATKQATRRAGVSPATVAERRQGVVEDDGARVQSYRDDGSGLGAVGEGVRLAGHMLQHPSQRQSRSTAPQQQREPTSSYHYPSVPTKEGAMYWDMPSLQPGQQLPPPSRPAKHPLDRTPNNQSPPPPPIPTRPSKTTFKSTATTESGTPLRPLLLPPSLRTTFLNLAHANTLANLETCGILCGTLISNALIITHLIIPDQHSTSDTCDTTEAGDNALFDYADSHNLLVCGWIHTHPSQSCFLSSRDLHTSSGYQVMLPEAIAIVCAPRHNPDWGIFRLTDPPGLGHVLRCERKGLFHPHEETRLYTDAGGKGHVVEGQGLRFEVVDLRV
ncbi:uncharacterized protein LTR77_003291 [Saxophila tyrrhenica]|uniref:MPN domain-containing protein n=1 Tax=Saxophila tyrrhenica TaxID=1690608 RepID=A0AAV9PHE6_9PEZI|nr:hypothetical protein LTR77_003291 [Saxophila tyrrhenica]